jgi:Protein of unknown function (DUF742)
MSTMPHPGFGPGRPDPASGGSPGSGRDEVPLRRRSARVRPYALTGGRVQARHPLLVETLVTANRREPGQDAALSPEARAIHAFCSTRRSIAEIAAVLSLPLGVVRVLVGDLADAGRVRIHPVAAVVPRRELLERVLRGLKAA